MITGCYIITESLTITAIVTRSYGDGTENA